MNPKKELLWGLWVGSFPMALFGPLPGDHGPTIPVQVEGRASRHRGTPSKPSALVVKELALSSHKLRFGVLLRNLV